MTDQTTMHSPNMPGPAMHHPDSEAIDLLKRQAARRPEFFAESGLDQMFSLVMELTAEVWVLRERMFAFESVSAADGNPLATKLAGWQPTNEEKATLAAMRHAMFQNLFRTIDTGLPAAAYEGETADPIPPERTAR